MTQDLRGPDLAWLEPRTGLALHLLRPPPMPAAAPIPEGLVFVRSLYTLPFAAVVFSSTLSASDVVDMAATLIGRPYVWGAEGPRAFDCSGLTQYVFAEFGIDLPRQAIQQSEIGDPIGRGLERGDLVFFASDGDRALVTHVGIYEGRGVMINASQRHGRVRRDDLNEPFWTTRFMFARRVLDEQDARVSGRSSRKPRDDRADRNDGKRRDAARIIERIAEGLLRRYPRR